METLARQGWMLDPTKRLYQLLRHVPYEKRKQCEGDVRLALDYYEASEILSLFLADLTGERRLYPDQIVAGGSDSWKEAIFGIPAELFDYDERTALANVVRHYGLDPRTRVLVVVEGETEQEFINTWCTLSKVDLDLLGIRILNIRGTSGLKNPTVQEYVRASISEGVCVVTTIDNENDSLQQLQKWIEMGLLEKQLSPKDLQDQARHPVGGLVWIRCFEEDNFTDSELIESWLKTLPADRVHKWQDQKAVTEEIVRRRGINPDLYTLDHLEHMGARIRKPALGSALAQAHKDTGKPIIQLLRKIIYLAQVMRTARYEKPKNTSSEQK
jgi:hypothetical protein